MRVQAAPNRVIGRSCSLGCINAMQRVKAILTRDNPAVFAPEVDARIRAKFAGMVAGDSLPPQGWKKVSASSEGEATTERRRRRRRRQRS